MSTLVRSGSFNGASVEVVKAAVGPNQVNQLNLAFKNIKDYTFLPNYKNLVNNVLLETEIDHTGNGLENIPEEVFKLKNLKKLNAAYNLISIWDDVPVNLEVLLLNNNRIIDITAYVTQMTKLYWLDLSNNIIPTVIPLNKVKGLKYLFMRNNKINWIRELAHLKWLLELDVAGNLIEDIDEVKAFESCTSIQVLNVSGNPVVE